MTILLVPGSSQTSLAIAADLHTTHPTHPYILGVRNPTSPTLHPHPTIHLDLTNSSTWTPALTTNTAHNPSPITTLYIHPPPLPNAISLLTQFIHHALSLPSPNSITRIILLSSSLIPLNGPAHGQIHGLLHSLCTSTNPTDNTPNTHPNLTYAVLRPTWFAQNFSSPSSHHMTTLRTDSTIYSATGPDGRVPFVDIHDIAAVAAYALTHPTGASSREEEREYIITGPEPLTYREVAGVLSAVLGREVKWEGLSVEGLAGKLVEVTGMGKEYALMLAGMDEAIEGGEEDRVTDVVRRVTGREARGFGEVMERGKVRGAWDGL